MNKNAKIIIFALLICIIGLLLASCMDDITYAISGKDGKCDYCGKEGSMIVNNTKEYCAPCFEKYDGNIWN